MYVYFNNITYLQEEGDGVVEDIMDQTLIASDNDSTAPASDSSVKEKNSTNMKV